MTKQAYRKILATATTATLAASAFAPMVSAEQSDFTDVSSRYVDAVNFLVSKGANGYTEDMFGTHMSIKRVDAAVLIAKVLELDMENAPASGFEDVPARAVGAVNALKDAEIAMGKNSKTFDSDSYVTRGEIALWLERAFQLEGTAEVPFKDVNSRYKDAVSMLVANHITQGISDTLFGVDSLAKRGDFAIFLHKAYQAMEDQADFHLTVMHTNDTHAHLDKISNRATAVNEVRDMNPEALLLDAGDVFSGDLYFNEFKGQADLAFMNALGYDAMTFGNHEFDLGASEDGHKALADFIKGAEFPLVSSNVDFSKDALFDGLQNDEISEDPSEGQIYNGIVKEIDGEKVGIFGLTTEETPDISSPESVEFQNYIDRATAMVDSFEAQGINKIIALTHIGFDDSLQYDNDLELAKLVDGIDVIVGGHSHTELDEPVLNEDGEEPTIIVQADDYGNFLGVLDVTFDDEGVINGYAGELLDVSEFDADPTFSDMLKPYSDQVEALKNKEIGADAASVLDGVRENVRSKETNLGNLITDGMLAKAKSINPKTVVALQNGGGIRESIDQGPITMGEVLKVMPFGNDLAIMELTGAEIKTTLERSVSSVPTPSGAFLQVSGLKVKYDSSKPAGERIDSVEISDGSNYAPLEDTKSYFVATNSFTAKGGDGYEVLANAYADGRVSTPGYIDYEMFIDYLKSLPSVDPQVEGRIMDVNTQN
ncbi:bifunctional metallophosphatase/5'-nucleotidase [Rossellomorea sp. YZS02]|uniref:bifunctional metallophosphatase/5'-nucleotidase n=1 Tax=Rossellomorea sp. YZS02 TaxID=3097358 RepID=UPI002A0CC4BA|nr:5'-nucleotidase C-terminal domain-containing protein [Rossellomorea sp. YZS02]MDX8343185.1 5'-nucleotidase C-terminal domain-containing protein [Rossellomorea sp. YZS02]